MKGLHIQKNKIAVIGLGISGKSVAQYFLKHNVSVDVFEDKKESDFDSTTIQSFTEDTRFSIQFSDSSPDINIDQYDYVIASPGVPMTHRLVVLAQSSNIECITDINTFLRIFRAEYPQGKVISVTGSNGKSTTVSLMYQALLSAKVDVYLGGNIGTSPLDFFDEIKTPQPIIILETSSYQLEYMKDVDYFDIACILNLSDNHLNRYGGKKELYAQAKLGGIDSEHTHALLNLDDAYTQKYIIPHVPTKRVLPIQFEHVQNEGVMTLENNSIVYSDSEESTVYLSDTSKMRLRGLHNIYNAAFVCGVLHILDIEPAQDIQKALYEFSGLIHRVQYVDSIQDITYINDSKSTSPDATVKALETLGVSKNIILISGGNDKDISYESMSDTWTDYVKALILLPGTANQKLKVLAEHTDVELLGEIKTMQEAIDIASNHASTGDAILLSPATDSHASFRSFEDRGNQFIQCIQNLKN
jgi:UDP-N-acetylmuramoylalanine--D-glutamate ligase